MSYSRTLKVLIVHITSADPERFKAKLNTNALFEQYYDGNEHTIASGVMLSTRYYYYDVPNDDLLVMLRHMHAESEGVVYQIKINPKGYGNHNFD